MSRVPFQQDKTPVSRRQTLMYNRIPMPTAAFTTLGCKVNQYETQRILESFEMAGFEIVPFDATADVYVVNSCSVTSIAEGKSRYTIRRASRTNPNAKVVVTGCASQMASNRGESLDGADLEVPNPQKLETLDIFLRRFPEFVESLQMDRPAELPRRIKPLGRTRATLKIQDGCDVLCSYCSIPYTRPIMTSRPWNDVLNEARKLAEMGYAEAVLTGVLIGAYGPETGSGGPCFEDLVEALGAQSGLKRIRISSIEFRQVTPKLVGLLKDGLVVPHLHIPLQSGDTRVLRDMNRPYSQDDYLRLCDRLYAEVPDISLTTDIMVGFPTEDQAAFESSVDVCEQVKFLKVHVFSFSPRFGTPADRWGDPVQHQEKLRRREALVEISNRTGERHLRKFVGRTMRVLAEGVARDDGVLEGLTDNYLPVRFAGPSSLVRQLVWVRLDEVRGGIAFGEIASSPSDYGLRVV